MNRVDRASKMLVHCPHMSPEFSSHTSMSPFSVLLHDKFILGLIVGQCLLFLTFYIFVRYFLFTTKFSPLGLSKKNGYVYEKSGKNCEELFSSFITDDDFYLLKKYQTCPTTTHDISKNRDGLSDNAWVNMLLRIIHRLPFTSSFTHRLLENVSNLINSNTFQAPLLEWVESISLKEWQWGLQSPTVSDIQYVYNPDIGVTTFRLHLDWSRPCSFTLASAVSLHSKDKIWIPLRAYLPISLSVHVERLSGYLFCSHKGSNIGLTLHPTFHISFRFDSELGNVSKLKNLPRISEWIHAHSILGIQQTLYLPNYHVFSINET